MGGCGCRPEAKVCAGPGYQFSQASFPGSPCFRLNHGAGIFSPLKALSLIILGILVVGMGLEDTTLHRGVVCLGGQQG